MLRERLQLEGALFLLALQFLTRLPIPISVPYSDDLHVRSAKYYPLVGTLVGTLGAAVMMLCSLVFSVLLSAVLAVVAMIFITGALHEDGLADTADGLGGGATREKALAIMRDSRVGVYGVLALTSALALKVIGLASLPLEAAVWTLIVAQTVSRMACVYLIASLPYARETTAKFALPAVTSDGYRVALATALVALAALFLTAGFWPAFAAMVLGGLATKAVQFLVRAKLGGYTGDTLGAVQQVSEISVLLGVLACL